MQTYFGILYLDYEYEDEQERQKRLANEPNSAAPYQPNMYINTNKNLAPMINGGPGNKKGYFLFDSKELIIVKVLCLSCQNI